MPLDQMWALTQPWYGDRLDADYRPRAVNEYQSMLTEVGLTDAFWRF